MKQFSIFLSIFLLLGVWACSSSADQISSAPVVNGPSKHQLLQRYPYQVIVQGSDGKYLAYLDSASYRFAQTRLVSGDSLLLVQEDSLGWIYDSANCLEGSSKLVSFVSLY